jgi:hypothetical protein
MIVEAPTGRNQEISRMYGGAFALNRGIRPVALENESKRRLRVPMGARNFSWQQ